MLCTHDSLLYSRSKCILLFPAQLIEINELEELLAIQRVDEAKANQDEESKDLEQIMEEVTKHQNFKPVTHVYFFTQKYRSTTNLIFHYRAPTTFYKL